MGQISQFQVATLKLTAWYLAILMTVSISFSMIIYQVAAHELDRPLPVEAQQLRRFERIEGFRDARNLLAVEGKRAVVFNLFIMNIATVALGAGASYIFARRTLHPIEEAMESQSRFVSDASHELRTPLAVMRAENEIALRERTPTTKSLIKVLDSNLEELDRLQQLTDRLLALSSQQPVDLVNFPIQDVVYEAVARHEMAANKRNITLHTVIEDVRVVGDSDTFCDIVSILIDNAIKYSPAETTVTITSQVSGRKVRISVADEGGGVSDEDKGRIFDRFYRGDKSRTKQQVEGHGLGLALAQRLCEINHAHLSVGDNTPHGAVFALEIDKS